jgi:hypothetical protein
MNGKIKQKGGYEMKETHFRNTKLLKLISSPLPNNRGRAGVGGSVDLPSSGDLSLRR